ncbi:MAG: hypothetical protein OEZ58_13080 [Gammaproteobacteria bacterium]|nr:hypothetical protein [Gammaproteobacteria bacterium]MDH5729922.1 hypothetical protein [Gammaproteobacteria bacterium]
MFLNESGKVVEFFLVLLCLILTACATTPKEKHMSQSQIDVVEMVAMEPSSPTEMVEPIRLSESGSATVQPALSGIALVADKMLKNPLTLYWKERNSYSYSVGTVLEAEYFENEKLLVKAIVDDNTRVECFYNMQGQLTNANEKRNQLCKHVMATLQAQIE